MTLQNITFESKNVLITGATGGLGRALAIEYAKRDCNLFLTGRNIKKLLSLRKELVQQYVRPNAQVIIEICDFTSKSDIFKMIEVVKERYKQIDILVNCAGVFPIKSLSETDIEEYQRCIDINLTAPFVLIKEFSKEMIENKWGRIINIASSSAYAGGANTSVYCTSKHALLGLSRSLYKEFKQHNVRVICVSPGSIKTDMGKDVEKLGQDFNTFMEPDEIAQYIVYNSHFDGNLISEEVRLNRVHVQ